MSEPSWKIGDVTVTRVQELTFQGELSMLVAGATREAVAPHASWLVPHFMDAEGNFVLSIHALVVEAPGRRILVDTCVGNHRTVPGWDEMSNLSGPFLEDLAAAGFPRESIDTVVCTHLHFDHVGWNTMKDGDRWVPTFPSARYLFARAEWEHWSREEGEFTATLGDAVRPVIEAGLTDLVEPNHVLCDEVRLEPTPGHTPGHVSVRISSRGEEAVITGDLVHHPVQLAEPEWKMIADTDAQQAIETRRGFVERYGDRPVLVIGTHFAGPTAGHIVRRDGRCRFEV